MFIYGNNAEEAEIALYDELLDIDKMIEVLKEIQNNGILVVEYGRPTKNDDGDEIIGKIVINMIDILENFDCEDIIFNLLDKIGE